MIGDYNSILKNDVWEIVPRANGKWMIDSICLYKIKHAIDGIIEMYKSRFVARAFS